MVFTFRKTHGLCYYSFKNTTTNMTKLVSTYLVLIACERTLLKYWNSQLARDILIFLVKIKCLLIFYIQS